MPQCNHNLPESQKDIRCYLIDEQKGSHIYKIDADMNPSWVRSESNRNLIVECMFIEKHWLAPTLNNETIPTIKRPFKTLVILSKDSVDLTVLEEIYSEGIEQCSKEVLAKFIHELKSLLIYNNTELVDQIFDSLDYSKLSPHIIVASLRITFPIRSALNNWKSALISAREELTTRNIDTDKILAGLSTS